MKQKPYRPEFCLALLRALHVPEKYNMSLFLGASVSAHVVLNSNLVYMPLTLHKLNKHLDDRILDHQSPLMPVSKLHQLVLLRDDNGIYCSYHDYLHLPSNLVFQAQV